ncbi:MAG: hypothetical protein IJ149_06200 [Oscillospiraceae bacterium]|nr:hypothetical protein [Oscillospiraceae bacterium]
MSDRDNNINQKADTSSEVSAFLEAKARGKKQDEKQEARGKMRSKWQDQKQEAGSKIRERKRNERERKERKEKELLRSQ